MPPPSATEPKLSALDCRHGNVLLRGELLRPGGDVAASGGTRGAVLMFPGATGAAPSFRKTMRELADAGYVVAGIDMYGADADISTPEAAGEHFVALLNDPSTLRDRVVLWHETVRALEGVDASRIAAIGYCFGGKCVLELARSGADLQAVVSYHGLLTTHAPAQPNEVRCRVAVWSGGKDPYAPVAELDALRSEFDAAGVDYQVTLFSRAQHSFTDPDHDGLQEGIAYDRTAHRVAWAGTLALLEETIGQPATDQV